MMKRKLGEGVLSTRMDSSFSFFFFSRYFCAKGAPPPPPSGEREREKEWRKRREHVGCRAEREYTRKEMKCDRRPFPKYTERVVFVTGTTMFFSGAFVPPLFSAFEASACNHKSVSSSRHHHFTEKQKRQSKRSLRFPVISHDTSVWTAPQLSPNQKISSFRNI